MNYHTTFGCCCIVGWNFGCGEVLFFHSFFDPLHNCGCWGFLNDFFCGLDVENLFFGDDFSLLHLLISIPVVGFLDDLLLDVENLFSGDSPPPPSSLHLIIIIIIIIVVVGLLDDFCGLDVENLFSLFVWVGFFRFSSSYYARGC